MKINLQKVYRNLESYDKYLYSNKERLQSIKEDYLQLKKYFGKNVLDLCCGGGILGFLLEKRGHNYLGIDINPDMINSAKEDVKKINSKNKFILGDILNFKSSKKFDTISLIGNSLGHINTPDLSRILERINSFSKKGTYFIIDYRDVVKILFDKNWRGETVEKRPGKKTLKRLTLGLDVLKGDINVVSQELSGKNKIPFTHSVWSPFILQPLMESFGWKIIKRKENKEWQGWTEIYKRK